MHDPNKKAVCCIVPVETPPHNGISFVAVSRKYDHNDFGLPGGKVDPGESIEEACLRELEEETGLKGEIIQHLYTGYEIDYLTSCFLVKASGTLQNPEDNVVKICSHSELFEGSFGTYNRIVLGEYAKVKSFGTHWEQLAEV